MALDFIAGCLGGSAGVLVGHPFDTVKVRLQTQDAKKPLYRGTFHCFSKIISQEKLTGLYKGMSSPLAGIAVINAIVFGVYGNMMRKLHNPEALSSHFFAGSAAGFVQSFVCSPMELAKTRMQLQGPQERLCNSSGPSAQQYKNPLQCLWSIKQREGWGGVFRGLGITVWREVPGFGLYFMTYEWLTTHQMEDPNQQLSTLHMMLAGGASGIISWVTTYPIDVLKTRLQADGSSSNQQYAGVFDCIRKSIQSEGMGVFTRGLTSTIIRAFPTNAATFTVVEYILRWYGKEEEIQYESISHAETLVERWHGEAQKHMLDFGIGESNVNFAERWKAESQKQMLELGALRQSSVFNTARTVYDFCPSKNMLEKTPNPITVTAIKGKVGNDHKGAFDRSYNKEYFSGATEMDTDKTGTCSSLVAKDIVISRRRRACSAREPLDLLKLGDIGSSHDTHSDSRQFTTSHSVPQMDYNSQPTLPPWSNTKQPFVQRKNKNSVSDTPNINRESDAKQLLKYDGMKGKPYATRDATSLADESRKQRVMDSDGVQLLSVGMKQDS